MRLTPRKQSNLRWHWPGQSHRDHEGLALLRSKGETMGICEAADVERSKWDPQFTEQLTNIVRPFIQRYFRTEVDGIDNVPPNGGALLVSNHSGGTITPDVFVLGSAYYERFG